MSEGFQQYALDLDSKRDSNIGLMRPLFRDDHSQSVDMPSYPKISDHRIPTRKLQREPSLNDDIRSQKVSKVKGIDQARSDSQGIIVLLNKSNEFRTVDSVGENQSKYQAILAKRNAKAQGAIGLSENSQNSFDVHGNLKLIGHHRRANRRENQNKSMLALNHFETVDPYANDTPQPRVHLPNI